MIRITDLSGHEATVDITQGSPDQYTMAEDQMTFSLSGGMSDDTITLLGPTGYDYTLGSNVSITGIGVPWTSSGTRGVTGANYDPWSNNVSSKIRLDGPEADIEINGESMIGMLRAIEQRLNLLKPNETLESEWAELKALGEQYRALEQHILAKQATWDRLTAMPPPKID
jgi:hypothetical protein